MLHTTDREYLNSPAGTDGPRLGNGERLITLAATAHSLPGSRGNPHVNPATVFRWITRGAQALDGSRVRLEAVRLGNRWLTSAEAIARFAAALTSTTAPKPPQCPPVKVRRASVDAAEALSRMGI